MLPAEIPSGRILLTVERVEEEEEEGEGEGERGGEEEESQANPEQTHEEIVGNVAGGRDELCVSWL